MGAQIVKNPKPHQPKFTTQASCHNLAPGTAVIRQDVNIGQRLLNTSETLRERIAKAKRKNVNRKDTQNTATKEPKSGKKISDRSIPEENKNRTVPKPNRNDGKKQSDQDLFKLNLMEKMIMLERPTPQAPF